jgi:hypothetical protein
MLTYLDNPVAGYLVLLITLILVFCHVGGWADTLRTVRRFVKPKLARLANLTIYRNVTRPEVVARLTDGIVKVRQTTAECLQKYGEALE